MSGSRAYSRSLRLAPQPSRENECAKPPLGHEKRRRRAAPSALAVEHVLLPLVQGAEGVPDLRQRDIDRTRKLVVLVLGGVAHVYPLGTAGDLRARFFRGQPLQQGLAQQLDE